jgi:hypothetical protein
MRDGGSGDEDVEVTRLPPLPPSKQCPDLFSRSDPRYPRQLAIATSARGRVATFHGATRPMALRTPALPAGTHYEPLATAFPARIQHFAAAARRHASTEAMFVDALAIARAISRLHRELSGCFDTESDLHDIAD